MMDDYRIDNYIMDDHRYDYERGYSFGYIYIDEGGYLMEKRHLWGIGLEDYSELNDGNIVKAENIGSLDESLDGGLTLKIFKFFFVGFLIVWLLIFLLSLFSVLDTNDQFHSQILTN